MVVGFYLISVAVDVCDLDITKEQEKRLEGWIEWAEGKLKVADRKLDKAYSDMEAAAKKDKTAFCAEMKPVAAKSVTELPALLGYALALTLSSTIPAICVSPSATDRRSEPRARRRKGPPAQLRRVRPARGSTHP